MKDRRSELILAYILAFLINGQFLYFGLLEFLKITSNTIITGCYFGILTISAVVLALNARPRVVLVWQASDIAIAMLYIYVFIRAAIDFGSYDPFILIYYFMFGPVMYFTGRLLPVFRSLAIVRSLIRLGVISIMVAIYYGFKYDFTFSQGRFAIEASNNPLLTGFTFAITAVSSILYYINIKKNISYSRSYESYLAIIVMLISIGLVFLSGSKQPVIALVVVFGIAFMQYPYLRTWRIGLPVLFFTIVTAMSLYQTGFETLYNSFSTAGDSLSTLERLALYQGAWEAFQQAPLFGVGLSRGLLWAHNLYLDTMGHYGLFGLVCILIASLGPYCWWVVAKWNKKLPTQAVEHSFLLYLYVIQFVSVMVSGSLLWSVGYFLPLGMLVSFQSIIGRPQGANMVSRQEPQLG